MSQRNPSNEIFQTILGILLLLGCHIIAIIIIFGLGYVLELNSRSGSYVGVQVWIIGGVGFLFWQLLYVIPLCIFLQRKRQIAMRNGVVIGAAITALLNGGCFLLMNVR
ncbi:hypothetical protein IQ244_11865 [Nostoc sp. LEGE 06077]|uniref:hypothetical protein n=1 Tax=Nostoc sp. LEGE 06077 TaxID=915325 RepID=UPI00187F1DB3|nr:hypothetical protein [Nostoc sp. LEGE 06077]MBE9207208.1 hypothetical protein [Nostoc sp. LEGE 06077]